MIVTSYIIISISIICLIFNVAAFLNGALKYRAISLIEIITYILTNYIVTMLALIQQFIFNQSLKMRDVFEYVPSLMAVPVTIFISVLITGLVMLYLIAFKRDIEDQHNDLYVEIGKALTLINISLVGIYFI